MKYDQNTVLVYGGKGDDQANVNWLWKIDLRKEFTVSRITEGNLGELPAIDSHEMLLIRGLVYCFGGFLTSPSAACTNKVIELDYQQSRYRILEVKGAEPSPRLNVGSCVTSEGDIIILGGADERYKYSDMYVLRLQTREWVLLNKDLPIKVGPL